MLQKTELRFFGNAAEVISLHCLRFSFDFGWCFFVPLFHKSFNQVIWRLFASVKIEQICCILNAWLLLQKIPQFHLISWCRNFVERYSFHIISSDSREAIGNCAFPKSFYTGKLGEITVFYAVCSKYSF